MRAREYDTSIGCDTQGMSKGVGVYREGGYVRFVKSTVENGRGKLPTKSKQTEVGKLTSRPEDYNNPFPRAKRNKYSKHM